MSNVVFAVVTRIREAPSPSSFVLQEDMELRRKVMHVLQKKERKQDGRGRKERISSSSSDGSVSGVDPSAGKVRRKSSPAMAGSNVGAAMSDDASGRKKKHLAK